MSIKCLLPCVLFQFVNDLEKDKKYAGWPSSLQDFLRPTFPGMLRHVRKNIFHLVSMCVKFGMGLLFL